MSLIIFRSIKVFFSKKIFKKFEYYFNIVSFLISKKFIQVFLAKYVEIFDLELEKVIYIIKTSIFSFFANKINIFINKFFLFNKK